MSRTKLAVTVLSLLLVTATVPVGWQLVETREQQAASAKAADLDVRQVTERRAPADYDGDGINDSADDCPTRPETENGFQDGDGCPDVVATTGAS
ncbi:hypothetical protein [Halorientalis salina]|uniref:hypothetical protein n=1 Tax=Halorientalis salina TaxID=2932266 RepID=UPI0010AB5392|nr:hypothetical protein [Halorientalis salina]